MKWQISKKFQDTVEITIWDDEPNSSDKEAYLDLVLNKYRDPVFGSWGSRHINSDNIEYQIDKRIWDNNEFQEKYFLINLML